MIAPGAVPVRVNPTDAGRLGREPGTADIQRKGS